MAEVFQEFKRQFKELHSLYVSSATVYVVTESNTSGVTHPKNGTKTDCLPESAVSGGHSHTGHVKVK
jgi:hypothetical protein